MIRNNNETEKSSRLIIKNLPSRITEERLKNICNKLGLVTDCQLKYTKNGLFRNFAFVGFRTIEEAESAKNYLHQTFIDASRVQAEFCQRLTASISSEKKKKRDDEATKESLKPNTSSTGHNPKVIIENLPNNVKKKSIKTFLIPLKPLRIDIAQDKCSAVVTLQKHSDVKILLKFNGRFFGGNKLSVKVDERDKSEKIIRDERPLEVKSLQEQTAIISETGRLFVRNIPYVCNVEDLQSLFEKYGPLAEIKLPLDNTTKKHKGYALISYVLPEHALKAFSETDGIVFNGRMLHIVPGEESKDEKHTPAIATDGNKGSSYKSQKSMQQKQSASTSHNWNALFLGANAVADVLVDKLDAEKSELLDPTSKTSLGTRMALGETQLVRETRDFLLQYGVSLDSFSSKKRVARSSMVIIAKNLPAKTASSEIRELFSKYGDLGRVVLPDSGVSALIEFLDEQQAKKAFKSLAYKRFKTTPLFLEWAPGDVFSTTFAVTEQKLPDAISDTKKVETKNEITNSEKADEPAESGSTIFVKNLNFTTTDEQLKEHFAKIGSIKSAIVAKKKSAAGNDTQNFLSMGYGFVQYVKRADAIQALKQMQKRELDGFALELKLSERDSDDHSKQKSSKKDDEIKPTNESETKLLVRNIPFQASKREIEDIFKTFGELRNVRLPRKTSSQAHRGFGFVDFTNKSDAHKAFDALSHSTHLYGRRLVLSWAAEEESLDELRKRVADVGNYSRSTSAKQQKIMLDDLD